MNTVQSTGGGHGGSMKKVDKHEVSSILLSILFYSNEPKFCIIYRIIRISVYFTLALD